MQHSCPGNHCTSTSADLHCPQDGLHATLVAEIAVVVASAIVVIVSVRWLRRLPSTAYQTCARYSGHAKTHLQHLLTATALNVLRLGAWLTGAPLAPTRESAFSRFMAQAA